MAFHRPLSPPAGRTVSRSEYEEDVEALRARMDRVEAPARYRRRQTAESVNADRKGCRRLRRFRGRGPARARRRVGLVALTQNLLTLPAQEKKAQPQAAARAANAAEIAA